MATPITMGPDGLVVPNDPIIPFIEGDGIGPDIWAAAVRVFDAAVEKAYGGDRKIAWKEVLAGEKAFNETGEWLPKETVDSVRHLPGRHQGPADHAGRRWHPEPQCGTAPDDGPVRVLTSGTLV